MASFEDPAKSWARDRDKFKERTGDASEAQKEIAFVQWLTENGGKFADCVELRSYDDEVRGVHATRDLETEEILVEVPLKCLITVEMGKATDVGRAVLEAELELDAPKHVFLMLFVLLDRRDSSTFFAPYYDILPSTLSNMPIFWQPDELEWLKGSYLLTQIEERKRAIKADYEAICGIWPSFIDVCTLEEFKWARMCVCSRNFGVVVNGARTSAMVPYADMLNHFRPRETKWTFDNSRGAFTITSLQKISVGSQIYDSYGQKCNHRFLLNYGFAIEDNKEPDGFCPNEAALLLQLSPHDALASRKQLLWIRDGAVGAKRIRVCANDNENFRGCMSLLRVMAADEADLDRILGQNPYGSYRTASDVHFPISLRNECEALNLLKHICQSMLDHYPCDLSEDIQALANDHLMPFSNERHARIHVKSEKVVLHHYVRFATTALELTHMRPDDFDASVARLFNSNDHRHVATYSNGILRQVRRIGRVQVNVAKSSSQIDLSSPTIV
jgi:histone-lysine N-methyltransferase SETD3|mmetsp:Transcript_20610/g.71331  ORF Transcript_20610/g.71331 Transcript_20610/m.71331 type:complete len:502 (-) Transcript_20610:576-2081(-)